jgi:hypothetical protein
MKKLLILVALVGTLIPTAFVLHEAGGLQNWQGVLPKGQVDSLYYYARIHEVADGHPLLGNPYLYEHREAFTPSFFIPDIVSVLPLLVGLPFDVAIAINMFVWSLVFLGLSFALFRLLQLPQWWAFGGSVLTYAMAFAYLIRPTILQLIYPIFLSFLIVLLKFLNKPLERRRALWLSAVSALAFYAYTLLAFMVFIILGCIFFWSLFTRRFEELRALVISGLFTAFLLIPFAIYTFIQMNDPYYLETFIRMGLVYTHIPALELFYYGRWVIIGLMALGLLWCFNSKKESQSEQKVFWLATGAGLLAGLLLNVITGVDVSLAIHTGRFLFLWVTMILSVLVYQLYLSQSEISKINTTRYIVTFLILILFVGVMRNIPPGPSFFDFNKAGNFADTQKYAGPLNWLESHESKQSVVWANESISTYIPIMTRHYVLSHASAAFHSFSGKELEDRYLLSRSLTKLTIEDLKRDLEIYTGLGSYLQSFSQNQRASLCRLLAPLSHNYDCPLQTDAVAYRGENYFRSLETRFDIIKKNQANLLKYYHVSYLIIDRFNDNIDAKRITNHRALYDDGRFIILSVPL